MQRTRANAMFKSDKLGAELQALKNEMSHLLNMRSDDVLDAAKSRTESFAEQVKAAVSELGETLSEEEAHVERLVAERPIAALASALAVGVVIGLMLRRH